MVVSFASATFSSILIGLSGFVKSGVGAIARSGANAVSDDIVLATWLSGDDSLPAEHHGPRMPTQV